MQKCILPPLTCPPVTSEDCLLLNIYAPVAGSDSHSRPVMFYIHGGNFKAGFAGGILYNGTRMARDNDVVVVTINYRLGAFGFLRHKEIEGNYGLEDQLFALAWVRRNIAAFGGNPNDVTLFGQSAGAQSVSLHALNPNITSHFGVRRMIMQSNPWGLKYRTDSTWGGITAAFAKASNCSCIPKGCIAKCLKALPASDLISAQVVAETNILYQLNDILALFEPWTPTLGTELAPAHPYRMFQENRTTPGLAMIIGSVQDEGQMFIYEAFGKPVPKLEYDALLPAILGLGAGAKIASHVKVNGNDARAAFVTVATDGLFHCPARATVAHRSEDTWLYDFDHPMSFYGNGSFGGTQPECAGLTCHAGDLPFTFFPDNLADNLPDHGNYTTKEAVLGDAMHRYWGTFAKTGRPGEGAPEVPLLWAPYVAGTGVQLHFSTASEVQGDPWAEKCAFWDKLGYSWVKVDSEFALV